MQPPKYSRGANGEEIIEFEQGTFTTYPDGRAVMENEAVRVNIAADGQMTVDSKVPITQVQLTNILEVVQHDISQTGDLITHKIMFGNGDIFELTIHNTGQLQQASGKAQLQLSKEGVLTLSKRPDDQKQPPILS
ncbi:MAG TPA: hypothetical protein VGL66_19290 [Caulobacteraceae bacterium]|jgi:hypothetical protein